MAPSPPGFVRRLLALVGWALFAGTGVALGLALGAATADVPLDRQMLVALGGGAAVLGLLARLVSLIWPRFRRAGPAPARAPERPTRAAAAKTTTRRRSRRRITSTTESGAAPRARPRRPRPSR